MADFDVTSDLLVAWCYMLHVVLYVMLHDVTVHDVLLCFVSYMMFCILCYILSLLT